jgi:hypothetical protein
MRRLSRPRSTEDQSRRLSCAARIVLAPVAAIGAVLSWRSLYNAAVPTFGPYAAGFPLLVDLLILGASIQYIAGTKVGRPVPGWRLTAHAGVFGTLMLNALAAEHLGQVPWHVTAPAVWAALVELTAKQVRGEWAASHAPGFERISLTLWLTAPMESARTRLLMLRTGIPTARSARVAVGVHAAAREALRLTLPKRRGRRARKIINRQLRAGSLPPTALLNPLGWAGKHPALLTSKPENIMRAVLLGVLDPAQTASRQAPAPSDVPALSPSVGDHPGIGDPSEWTARNNGDQSVDSKPRDANNVGGQEVDDHEHLDQNHSYRSLGNARVDRQQRLAEAVEIVTRRPAITGPELGAVLAARGWPISDRTATRILLVARGERRPSGTAAWAVDAASLDG